MESPPPSPSTLSAGKGWEKTESHTHEVSVSPDRVSSGILLTPGVLLSPSSEPPTPGLHADGHQVGLEDRPFLSER